MNECIVIDPTTDALPADPYVRRLWRVVRFARAAGCSDGTIRWLIRRDVERHPIADEQMVARLVLAALKWKVRNGGLHS